MLITQWWTMVFRASVQAANISSHARYTINSLRSELEQLSVSVSERASNLFAQAMTTARQCNDKSSEVLLVQTALLGTQMPESAVNCDWVALCHTKFQPGSGYASREASSGQAYSLKMLSKSIDFLMESEQWLAAMDSQKHLIRVALKRRPLVSRVVPDFPKEIARYFHISQKLRSVMKNLPATFSLEPPRRQFLCPEIHDLTLFGPDLELLDDFAKRKRSYIKSQDCLGRTLLHLACDPPNPDLVYKLLYYTVNLNAQDECGQTALHYLCNGTNKVPWGPLAAGASILEQEEERRLQSLTALLSTASTDIGIKDKDGAFAHQYAMEHKRHDVVLKIWERGRSSSDEAKASIIACYNEISKAR